jgi:hypothetical protein
MNNQLKTTLLAAALFGGGVVGAGAIGASASAAETAPAEPAVTADAFAAAPGVVATDTSGCNGRSGRGTDAIVEALGITREELHEARQAGMSIAQIAEQQGVDVADVVQAIVDDVADHLANAVADGDLTQAEADARLAEAEQRAVDRVNRVPDTNAAGGEAGESVDVGAADTESGV